MSDIILLVLKSGEQIVCEFEQYVDSSIIIKNPIALVMGPGESQSKPNVAMVRWSPFTKEGCSIKLSSDDVLYTSEPTQEVVNSYNSIYGSGIIVAGSNTLRTRIQ